MASSFGDTIVNTTEHTITQNARSPHSGWQHNAPNISLLGVCIPLRFTDMQYLPWDNPDNIVSSEAERITMKIKNTILAVLILVGVPANVINMAVFFKQSLTDRVNLCLFAVSLMSNLYLISAMLLHAENIYLYFSAQEIKTTSNTFMANNNIFSLIGTGYVCLIMSTIITCERCYCVLRPLKYQALMHTRTMALIIISVTVLVLGLYFIVSYRYYTQCFYDSLSGAVLILVAGGQFYHTHKEFIDLLESVFFAAGISGGMMVVTMIATIITAVKLHQIKTWRSEALSALSPREVALSKMLVGYSVFFIICTAPVCLFRVLCLFLPEMRVGKRHHNFYLTALWILEAFSYINATFNFFVYYAMGSRYRETFWALFGRKVKNSKPEN